METQPPVGKEPPVPTVPLVDFSPFSDFPLDAPPQITREHLTVAEQIDAALRRHGVFLLRNFGLPTAELHAAFDTTRQLFALPLQHKLSALKQYDSSLTGGYSAPGMESFNHRRADDLKESYNITDPVRVKPNYDDYPPAFESVSTQFYNTMTKAGARLAIACALALKLPLNYFAKSVQRLDVATVRMIHYPACDFVAGETSGDDSTSSIRFGEHRDLGFFTFLFCDSGGLQVKLERDACARQHGQSEWMDVPVPAEGCAIVMIGRLAARVTNDVWLAPMHRVVVKEQHASKRSRYSLGYFHEPDRESVIETHPRFFADGEARAYDAVTSGSSMYTLVAQSLSKERRAKVDDDNMTTALSEAN